MATLERTRPPTVTIPRSPVTSPLASPSIIRTPDAIVLPSVPTHEPEDDHLPRTPLPLRIDPLLSRTQDGGADEDEDVMEELKDDADELEEAQTTQHDLASSLFAVEHSALQSLRSLLQSMLAASTSEPSSPDGALASSPDQRSPISQLSQSSTGVNGPRPILFTMIQTVDQISAQLQGRSAPASPTQSSKSVSPNSASTQEKEDEVNVSIARLNGLLESLPQNSSPSVVSEDIQLATALGTLLSSLEQLRSTTSGADPQALPRSPAYHRRRGSVNSVGSGPTVDGELRDPFAETVEPDVFSTLHRSMASLSARYSETAKGAIAPAPLSPKSPVLGINGASSSTVPDSATPASDSVGTPEMWSRANELLNITKELVASRRAATASIRSPVDAVLSPSRTRSRRGSNASPLTDHADMPEFASGRLSRTSTRSGSVTAAGSVQEGKTLRHSASVLSDLSRSSLPPRYSAEEQRYVAGATEAQLQQHREQMRAVLPEYVLDEKSLPRSDEKGSSSRTHRSRGSQSVSAAARGDYAARTSADLSLVQHSIDRLYDAVPQLSDQRATLSSRKLKELHLAEVVDRLGRVGRMDDQRASPPVPRSADPSTSSTPIAPESLSRGNSHLRRFSVPGILNRSFSTEGKGKGREIQTQEDLGNVGMLLEQVQKANGLSMSDQRVELKPKIGRQQQLSGLVGGEDANSAGRDVFFDSVLIATTRGRFSDQDAIYPPVRIARLGSVGDVPDPGAQARIRTRSRRSGTEGDARNLFVPAYDFGSKDAKPFGVSGDGNSGNRASSPLRSDPGASIGNHPDHTRARDVNTLGEAQGIASSGEHQAGTKPYALSIKVKADRAQGLPDRLAYVAEWQANLKVVTVLVSLTAGEASGTSAAATAGRANSEVQAHLTYRVLATEHDTAYLFIFHPTLSNDTILRLPTPVILGQAGSASLSGDHYSLKLRAGAASIPRSSSDVFVPMPLSAASLQAQRPPTFRCSSCSQRVINSSATTRYRALPSEHWEELVDAWMCHGDQELNVSVARGREGMDESKKLPDQEAWVGDVYLLWPGTKAIAENVRVGQHEKEVITETENGAMRICCTRCASVLGSLIVTRSTQSGEVQLGLPPTPTPGTTLSLLQTSSLRVAKYAVRPSTQSEAEAEAEEGKKRTTHHSHRPPPPLLPLVVAAQLIELSQAHAAHHFVVEDEEEGNAQLLLWLFLPSFNLVFSPTSRSRDMLHNSPSVATATANASHSGADLEHGQGVLPDGTHPQPFKSISASKVFFQVIGPPQPSGAEAETVSTSSRGPGGGGGRRGDPSLWPTPTPMPALGGIQQIEHLTYPLQYCHQLAECLRASNLIYPPSRRSFGKWSLGWLQRGGVE